MAQKREKEETELKVPENIPLCIPHLRTPENLDPKVSPPTCDQRNRSASSPVKPDLPETNPITSLKRPREVTRCSGSGCRKRVGLVGIRCRCGDTFCSDHRYSDRHDCSYDYKAAGRDAIAKENPLVRAAKLLKV